MGNIRFGVNYIPSKNWLHSWNNWDSVAVEEDLIATKNLGADHIRANLIWPYFQVDPNVMSPSAMKNLEELMHICEKVGIDCVISLFTGWISGSFFFPAWQERLTGEFGKGIFDNPEMLKAEEFYIRKIADVVAKSERFMGFDLGNELSVILHHFKDSTVEKCDLWNKKMMSICEEVAPGKLHNNGVDHIPWFLGTGFSREELTNTGKITAMHTYSLFTGAIERFGKMSTESLHLAPFMMEMAKAFASDINRPYWIQEFGTAASGFDDESEEFVVKSINAMFTCENLWGITWWCTHNIPKEYLAFDELEYELGLLDNNNNPTRAGKLFSKIIKEYKESAVEGVKRTTAFVLKACRPDGSIDFDLIWENGKRYAELVDNGIYPAIILPEKVNDIEYLKKRGIEKII